MTTWISLGFTDSACLLINEIIFFHDYIIVIVVTIVTLILCIIVAIFWSVSVDRFLTESEVLEVVWTLIPMLVLFLIGVPSLILLYAMDELEDATLSLNVLGHQWYWSYEYSDFSDLSYDSYMVIDQSENIRLLEVDNHLVLPIDILVRVLVSSEDVIHAWTLPALALKIDAVPGRLNQLSLSINRPGIFIGQCSEICGANHSFMPIILESVSIQAFTAWVQASNGPL